MTAQPLVGRRILVTRAAGQAGKLSEGLRSLGATPVEVPVLEILPPASYEPLDAALRRLAIYDWFILTSANTVRVVAERVASAGLVPSDKTPKVAAIGSATAQAARDAGFAIALTPREAVAESLVESLAVQVAGKRVLLARAAVARDVLPDALRAAGAEVDVVDAYQNAIPASAPEQLKAALEQGIDAATFTSSSSATHLRDVANQAGLAFPFAEVAAISIGPVTSATLRTLGWEPAAEANFHDIAGLIEIVTMALS